MAQNKVVRTVSCDDSRHTHRSLEASRACVEIEVFGPVSAVRVFGVRPTISAIREGARA